MGEPIADTPSLGNKMGETAKSNPVLEVSVSFGRFENDALSWEKFSSFSPNKYLEEVEKCATPGSVAQKKAYFEAHYKKIAARKAELMIQEKQMENDALRSDHDYQNGGDLVANNGRIAPGYHLGDSQSSAEAVNEEVKLDNDRSNTTVDKPKEDNEVNLECQCSSVQEVKEELDSVSDSPESSKPEETAFRKELEEALSTGSQGNKELPQEFGDEPETTIKINQKNKKLDNLKKSQKVTPISKERNTTVLKKKTAASPFTKATQNSAQRKATKAPQMSTSKAMATTSQVSAPKVSARAPQILTPKVSSKAPQFSTPRASTKSPNISTTSQVSAPKVAARAPQILTPKVSSKAPQFSTPRASTKSPNISTLKVTKPKTSSTAMSASRLSTHEGIVSSAPASKNRPVGESKKMASKSLHMSLSFDPPNSEPALGTTTRRSYIMEKMGDKDIVKRAFKTFQHNFNQLKSSSEEISSGAKQKPVKGAPQKVYTPTIPRKDNGGSLKAGGLDKRNTEAVPSSYGLRIDGRVEEQREEDQSEIKMPRQSLNFRATATSGFYLGQKSSKISLDKEGSKTLGL